METSHAIVLSTKQRVYVGVATVSYFFRLIGLVIACFLTDNGNLMMCWGSRLPSSASPLTSLSEWSPVRQVFISKQKYIRWKTGSQKMQQSDGPQSFRAVPSVCWMLIKRRLLSSSDMFLHSSLETPRSSTLIYCSSVWGYTSSI